MRVRREGSVSEHDVGTNLRSAKACRDPSVSPVHQGAGVESKTNVLIAVSSLWIGGAETVVRSLAEKIDRARFNLTVCCLKELGTIGRRLADTGVEVISLKDPQRERVDYFTFIKLARLSRRRRIDIIHSHTTQALVDAGLCRLLMPRLRVVHTFHFGNYPHLGGRLLWMERIGARLVDRLVSVGRTQRSQIRASHWLPERRICPIWNGVQPASSGRSSKGTGIISSRGRFVIGTIATLIEQKGLFDLLMVAARVHRARPDVVFVIVGEGHLRAEIERERKILGIDDAVVLTGWVPDAAQVVLPEFDVFFQPSLWEAMSVVVLEAMAAGKPVVATSVGENPYVVDHEVDGLLVRPRDIDGMTAALIQLIDDQNLRAQIGVAARHKVESRFSVDQMVRAYEQIYLDVLR